MLAIGQGFNTAVLLTFWSDNSLWQASLLCTVEYLAASLASAHQISVGPPLPLKCNSHTYLQTLPNTPSGKKSPIVDSHCLGRFITNRWLQSQLHWGNIFKSFNQFITVQKTKESHKLNTAVGFLLSFFSIIYKCLKSIYLFYFSFILLELLQVLLWYEIRFQGRKQNL